MIFEEFKKEALRQLLALNLLDLRIWRGVLEKRSFDSKRWKKTVTQKSAAFLVFQRKFNSLNWNPVRFQSWKARVSYVRM